MVGNAAYIDGQNLYKATTKSEDPWKRDLKRFRVYLSDKYKVERAYYFMGVHEPENTDLYIQLQSFGYLLVFREHSANLKGGKKGNVDPDIVFQMMKDVYEGDVDKVILVSGDGNYKRTVDHLMKMGRFEKILLPCKRYASSLYKRMGHEWYAYIDTPDMRSKLEYKKERGA